MQKTYKDSVLTLIENLKNMIPEKQYNIFETEAKTLAEKYKNPLVVKVGDNAPEFSLTDSDGKRHDLESFLKKGPVVLNFYRGNWCPYCSLVLPMYEELASEFEKYNATVIAVSPQNTESLKKFTDKITPNVEILSDVGNIASRKYTTVFKYSEESQKAMKDLGYDFTSFYADDSAELPVPAVFVIGTDGVIHYAASEGGDFRERTEPSVILEEVKKLSSK